jgi:hypothetical protein
MPHRGPGKGFGKLRSASVRVAISHASRSGDTAMINMKDLVDWASASGVMISGGLAGHYAATGMTPVQWAGAVCAVLGSVTVAVAVRVWPVEAKAPQRQRD